ncbi:UbiD family decarboxylase [Saccharopolyspora sp. WRP15-2]|uniref:UbiD family decarboxylase n=1 Tax=Saccharopolyspora oryzae TaxID=2997343 RepID=A0ABT4UZR6_9PSEU|nr:UbiD family decarboxylase [Saccharopolyspora oryzae]MDA3627207.1 UbiD family decarboxylase [Saccharopolyspora oryzae]
MNLSPRQDAHTFFTEYRRAHPDDVLVVDEPVSAEGVTGLIYELIARGRDEMLVCNAVEGVSSPVVTNVFAARHRIARFLDAEPGRLHEAYQSRASRMLAPRIVDSAPLVADEVVDLATVPMFQHFASDRAPYITSGIVVAEDPDTGVGNLSYHRAMVHSPTELATSLHSRGDLWRLLAKYAERGEPMPVAMVIGGHPLFMLAASARVPADVDERAVAGGLFGEPLDLVRTPRHGIGVPAWAEFVLEGTIDPQQNAEEGPFGEFSGYSSHRSTNNVLRVETVLRRDDALLVDVAGGNTADHLNLARVPRESELAEKLKDRFPDVTAVHYPTSGTHFHCYVAMRESRPGQARQVLLGLLGWDPYVKTAVAVDTDVDITSDAEVLWALATHFQPHRDLFVVDGLPGSPLDPSSDPGGTTSRMGLDATRSPDFAGDRIVVSATARTDARRLLGSDGGRR